MKDSSKTSSRLSTKNELHLDRLRRRVKIELCRRNFWHYCNALYPEFYTEDRQFLKDLCTTLQSAPKRLMINMPPRCFKSMTLSLYETWLLGHNQNTMILTVSYNDVVAGRFSKGVRNIIDAKSIEPEDICFSDVFPGVRIKRGDGSAQLWALEGQHFNYIGSGFNSSITGLGATLGIIDDPIKSSKEAYNPMVLEGHKDFYDNTFLSRIETGGRIIINHTRWCPDDLCGQLLASDTEWTVFKVQMEQPDGSTICPRIMTVEEMQEKKATISPAIWCANYQQELLTQEGSFYKSGFQLISSIPDDPPVIIMDVADKGADYVAAVSVVPNGDYLDVRDVFMDSTELADIEDKIINWIERSGAKMVRIEGNNVGNYFARTIKKKLPGIVIKVYTTTSNKESRIKAAQWWVQEYIRFHRSLAHTEFYKHLLSFDIKKSSHDDPEDVITAAYEIYSKTKFNGVGNVRI